jgi:hypothetical protein
MLMVFAISTPDDIIRSNQFQEDSTNWAPKSKDGTVRQQLPAPERFASHPIPKKYQPQMSAEQQNLLEAFQDNWSHLHIYQASPAEFVGDRRFW